MYILTEENLKHLETRYAAQFGGPAAKKNRFVIAKQYRKLVRKMNEAGTLRAKVEKTAWETIKVPELFQSEEAKKARRPGG